MNYHRRLKKFLSLLIKEGFSCDVDQGYLGNIKVDLGDETEYMLSSYKILGTYSIDINLMTIYIHPKTTEVNNFERGWEEEERVLVVFPCAMPREFRHFYRTDGGCIGFLLEQYYESCAKELANYAYEKQGYYEIVPIVRKATLTFLLCLRRFPKKVQIMLGKYLYATRHQKNIW
jgi:hypothetical protein